MSKDDGSFFLKLMPDEFHPGYLGRLKNVFLARKKHDLMDAIKSTLSIRGDFLDEVDMLAAASGKTRSEFVQGSTLLPFARMTTREEPLTEHYRLSASRARAVLSGQRRRMGPRYCPACVLSDMRENSGLSWWRRRHQVGGVDWCQVHKTPLLVTRRPHAFDFLPGDIALEESDVVTNESLDDWPVLERYLIFMGRVLERSRPVSHINASRSLARKALEVLPRPNSRRGRLLSDWMLECVSGEWLGRHFLRFGDKRRGHFFASIDMLPLDHSGGSQVGLGIALAALCETPDEMLHLLETEVGDPRSAGCLKRIGPDEIRALYIKHGGSHYALATEIGAPLSSVRIKLNGLGLPALGGMLRDPAAHAVMDVAEGMGLDDAIARHHACAERVSAWLSSDLMPLLPKLIAGVRRARGR